MGIDAQGKKLGQVLAKAWEDAAFKQRLLQDATTVLKEEGLPVPEGEVAPSHLGRVKGYPISAGRVFGILYFT